MDCLERDGTRSPLLCCVRDVYCAIRDGIKDYNSILNKFYPIALVEIISRSIHNPLARTINLYNGFITEANGRKRNMPSWQFILNNIDSYTEQDIEEKRLDYPRDIYYSATDHCNFYCRYCYRDSKKKNDKEDYVSYERWETLLKEAGENKCRFVNIAGGDPVLRADIDRLIDIASRNGLKSKISTKELVDITTLKKYKQAGLSIFQVSLDSYDAKTCALEK